MGGTVIWASLGTAIDTSPAWFATACPIETHTVARTICWASQEGAIEIGVAWEALADTHAAGAVKRALIRAWLGSSHWSVT